MADEKRTPILLGFGASFGFGALVATGLLSIDGGEKIEVDIYKPVVAGQVEIDGSSKGALATKLSESGAQGSVHCVRGGAVNEPEKYYCTDGGTAGFLLDAATEQALVGEVTADAGELAKAEVEIVAGEDGKIYASAEVVKVEEPAKDEGGGASPAEPVP